MSTGITCFSSTVWHIYEYVDNQITTSVVGQDFWVPEQALGMVLHHSSTRGMLKSTISNDRKFQIDRYDVFINSIK